MKSGQKKSRVRTAVFPVAGLGTRFLPATKASPKEMLPVVDKPLIQYAVEEAVEAGVDTLIFVTSRNKRAIEDHFDRVHELESELRLREKQSLLNKIKNIVPKHVTTVYLRQPAALGLGHAVLCAASILGNGPFYVILADDLIQYAKPETPNVLEQLQDIYVQENASTVALERVPKNQVSRYGIVKPKEASHRLFQIETFVEKPEVDEAPSDLAVIGRYLLTPRILDCLRETGQGRGGEIQLTDALSRLLIQEPVFGYAFEGIRYDCGDKLGYLQACVETALRHPELHDDFTDYLLTRVRNLETLLQKSASGT
jgi:UTP--glucose-1-phosphate uridylyltransferase